jgi:carboxypeptidase Taq
MRFDLKQELLDGRLAPAELPDTWRARFQADLGNTPADGRDGIMQDVHWLRYFVGAGYLGYTLGNIMSGQIFQKARQDHPEIETEMRQGRESTLLGWLNRNIYRHGRKVSAPDLLFRVTGQSISVEPFLHYLDIKYGPLYGLQVPEELP